MKDELLKLIADRKAGIQRTLDLLKQNWGKINWAANRGNDDLTTGIISKRGFLDEEQKISYNFHGAGIWADFEDEFVNFDFNFDSVEFSEVDHSGLNQYGVIEYLNNHKGKYKKIESFYSSENLSYDEKNYAVKVLLNELEADEKLCHDLKKDKYLSCPHNPNHQPRLISHLSTISPLSRT